jgi:hypothetical protein
MSLNRAILQHVAHAAGEDTDNRDGWCRWSTQPDVWPWDWNDYKPLVDLGLLDDPCGAHSISSRRDGRGR